MGKLKKGLLVGGGIVLGIVTLRRFRGGGTEESDVDPIDVKPNGDEAIEEDALAGETEDPDSETHDYGPQTAAEHAKAAAKHAVAATKAANESRKK